MSPIKGLSDRPRLPRLGKIHLGEKVENAGKAAYPRPTEHFVCPPDVKSVFGEKPRALRIAFPTEDPEQWASVFYRCYSSYRGLVCKGDGEVASRLVDIEKVADPKTGELPNDKHPRCWPRANRDTRKTKWFEITCPPDTCDEYSQKLCRPIMNLQFLLPDVPGIGVWQIDTASWNSIKNIRDQVKLIKGLCGRLSMIPLTLSLIPLEVQPEGIKKHVHVLQLTAPFKVAELYKYAALPPGKALLPESDLDVPEDLMPDEVIEGRADPVDGNATPDHEDDIFGPQAVEDRERQLCWKDICQLMADTNQNRDTLITWFQKRHNILLSLEEVKGDAPPRVATLAMLTQLRDNLKVYKGQMSENRD